MPCRAIELLWGQTRSLSCWFCIPGSGNNVHGASVQTPYTGHGQGDDTGTGEGGGDDVGYKYR